MNEIVYTISRKIPHGVKIHTANSTVDDADKSIDTVAVCLMMEMTKLTDKYNAKGYAVLFEVD